jgi:hypothetical protein
MSVEKHSSPIVGHSSFNTGVSFEVLHLLFGVSNRLEKAFKVCGLTPEGAYIIAYINARGQHSTSMNSGRPIRLIPRPSTLKTLQEVMGCNKDRANETFNQLSTDGLILAKGLEENEKKALGFKGTNEGYYLTEKGEQKLADVVTKMISVRDELMSPGAEILVPPGDSTIGSIGKDIQFFLRIVNSPGIFSSLLARSARIVARIKRSRRH